VLIDLSNYVLEPLREGEEYILYSGRTDGELPAILVVAPVSEYPALESLERPFAPKSPRVRIVISSAQINQIFMAEKGLGCYCSGFGGRLEFIRFT
jgi:hypothetical protein